MEPSQEVQPVSQVEPLGHPHNLAKQLVGLVFWILLFTLPTGRIDRAAVALLLGGSTFADAWMSGICKRPDSKAFLNISPMAWGLCVPMLFLIAYPLYLAKRNTLRTVKGSNIYFVATIVLGVVYLAVFAQSVTKSQ